MVRMNRDGARAALVGSPSVGHKPTVDIRDLEEALVLFHRLYVGARADLLPSKHSFSWSLTEHMLGPLVVLDERVSGGAAVRSNESEDRYVVVVPRVGNFMLHHGGCDGAICPARMAALISLHQPVALEVLHGTCNQTLVIDGKLLREHLRQLTGAELTKHTLHFAPLLDLSHGAGADLAHLLTFIVTMLDRPEGLCQSPLLTRSLTEALLSATLDLVPHKHVSRFSETANAVAPACVRRAEAYMDAHADQPITMSDVAAAVGVSVRALELAFRRSRDRSPHEHLRQRRLDRARNQLLQPEPGTSVAAVAHAAGYHHVGYFIAAYRRCFGETPGKTLRRTLGPKRAEPSW